MPFLNARQTCRSLDLLHGSSAGWPDPALCLPRGLMTAS
jgi:hypothetical protein